MDFEAVDDPLLVLDAWKGEAEDHGVPFADAITLATVDEQGHPAVRVVLLKARVGRELHFFTNYESAKARHLDKNPHAAVVIHYATLAKQIRVSGSVVRLSREISERYFRTRPRESQIGAWASAQSRPLTGRAALEDAAKECEARYEGEEVPCPPHWGGYALVADRVELWLGRPGRLHDRAEYTLSGQSWRCERLWP